MKEYWTGKLNSAIKINSFGYFNIDLTNYG